MAIKYLKTCSVKFITGYSQKTSPIDAMYIREKFQKIGRNKWIEKGSVNEKDHSISDREKTA